jgi:hypothetical protein
MGVDDQGVSDACANLTAQLDLYAEYETRNGAASAGLFALSCLLSERDIDPSEGVAKGYRSAPPWNQRSADALLDAHELVRRLEASIRLYVAGRTGRKRGGSDGNTRAALKAIAAMSSSVPPDAAREAARLLNRAATRIEQLAAVDTVPTWVSVGRGPDGALIRCYACGLPTLRFARTSGIVICIFPACPGGDDQMPVQGHVEVSRFTGEAVLAFRDGNTMSAPGEQPGGGAQSAEA